MKIKKVLSLVLTLAMILGAISTSVFAGEDSYVAQIGNVQYTTLQAAVDAATAGAEIDVIADITVEEPTASVVNVPKSADVIIDLNGYTVSVTKTCDDNYHVIYNSGKLTIKDSSEEQTGSIKLKDIGSGDAEAGWGVYTISNYGGTLTINGGTIANLSEQNKDSNTFKHTTIAVWQYDGTTIINGGTISAPYFRSLRVWNGDVTINGGIFEGQVWVQNDEKMSKMDSSLTINSGSFAPSWSADGSSVFVGHSEKSKTALSITGGNFATKVGCTSATTMAGLTGGITGGTFTEAAANQGATKALCEVVGYELKANGIGERKISYRPYVVEDGVTKWGYKFRVKNLITK